MTIQSRDMIGVGYDWDTGTWTVFVSGYGVELRRGGYELEVDAEEAKASLMHQLAAAPDGNVQAVLELWRKGEL